MCVEERRKNLFLVIDHLIEVHDEWISSDFEFLPRSFEEAADGLVEIFATGMIPGECRELSERVSEFGEQWEKWKLGPAAAGEGCPRSAAFWRALEAIRDSRSLAEPSGPSPSLEPIATLEKQGVGDGQICAIYGWGTLSRPDLKKLNEERVSPGKHTGSDFVPPAQRDWKEQQAKEAENIERIRRLREAKIAAPVPSESLEDLLEQGVSARQIAKNLGKTVDEVFSECDRRGLPRPAVDYADVRTARAPHEPAILPEVERALDAQRPNYRPQVDDVPVDDVQQDGSPTLEQEIVRLHLEGKNSRDIAELLTSADATVAWQTVASVIRHYKKQPEAFALPSEG